MPLPAVEELIVEDDAVYDQDYEACYCQCQSHMQHSSEWASEGGDQGPVWSAEESADDDEDHVENHQGKEDGVSHEPLLGKPSPHALSAAVDVGDDEHVGSKTRLGSRHNRAGEIRDQPQNQAEFHHRSQTPETTLIIATQCLSHSAVLLVALKLTFRVPSGRYFGPLGAIRLSASARRVFTESTFASGGACCK